MRNRYKIMIRAAVVGAAVVGIPLSLMLFQKQQASKDLQNDLSYYENREKQYQYTTVYYVKQDMTAGEALTEDRIVERQVQSMQDLSVWNCGNKEEMVGRHLKVSVKKGCALTTDLLYEGPEVAMDERRIELSSASVPKSLKKNEWIDIRILFPDGEDYIVASRKRVYDLQPGQEGETVSIELRFSEQELLRYQAAFVDVKTYSDTTIYCLQYTGDYQTAAQEFYPVNRNVFELMQWDPNITEPFFVAGEVQRRELLEEHLKKYTLDEPMEIKLQEEPAEPASITESAEPVDLYG